jgi:hypothetical protein
MTSDGSDRNEIIGMNPDIKIAEVVTNGRGQLFAQVAKDGEYTCWALTEADILGLNLRVYDEIVITACPQDQFCKVVGRYEPD